METLSKHLNAKSKGGDSLVVDRNFYEKVHDLARAVDNLVDRSAPY